MSICRRLDRCPTGPQGDLEVRMPSTIWSGAISFGLVTSLNYVAHRPLVGIL
jgi:hypothetical protein